jgi:hypothetical protein
LKSAWPDFEPTRFTVTIMGPARRTLDRETNGWEALHDEPSQLPDEFENAVNALAMHPYAGRRVPTRPGHVRKYYLRRTGFFIVYRVKPRLRVIEIFSLAAKRSLAHR